MGKGVKHIVFLKKKKFKYCLTYFSLLFIRCGNQDDSYMTVFHPVIGDSRVPVPSHFKRFSIKMFTFTRDDEVLKDEVCYVMKFVSAIWFIHIQMFIYIFWNVPQIHVHCDALICDTSSNADSACRGQCSTPDLNNFRYPGIKRGISFWVFFLNQNKLNIVLIFFIFYFQNKEAQTQHLTDGSPVDQSIY